MSETKTVLVVDDEPNIVLSLRYLMSKAGYRVCVATDGEAALEAIERERPDLVLLDLMIPKRDGYDVCQTLRADPRHRELPVVMLTARGREIDREKGLALGATAYLTKPFSTRELLEMVGTILAADQS